MKKILDVLKFLVIMIAAAAAMFCLFAEPAEGCVEIELWLVKLVGVAAIAVVVFLGSAWYDVIAKYEHWALRGAEEEEEE